MEGENPRPQDENLQRGVDTNMTHDEWKSQFLANTPEALEVPIKETTPSVEISDTPTQEQINAAAERLNDRVVQQEVIDKAEMEAARNELEAAHDKITEVHGEGATEDDAAWSAAMEDVQADGQRARATNESLQQPGLTPEDSGINLVSPNDRGTSLNAEEIRQREAENAAAREARSAEHVARKSEKEAAWSAATEDQDQAIAEANKLRVEASNPETMGINLNPEGGDTTGIDLTAEEQKKKANEQEAQKITAGRVDAAQREREEASMRRDEARAAGKIMDEINTEAAAKKETERRASLNLTEENSGINLVGKKDKGIDLTVEGQRQKVEQPVASTEPEQPVVAETTPEAEVQPTGKSRARRAGEIVGKVARAAAGAGKAMSETYKKAEAERIAAEKAANPDKKSLARKAGEVTGSIIRGTKRVAERVGEYRASRVEKKAEAAKLKAEKAEQARQEKEAAEAAKAAEKPKSKKQEAVEKINSEAEEAIALKSLQKEVEKLRAELREKSQAESGESELLRLLSEREKLVEGLTGKSMAERMADAEKAAGKTFGYERRIDYVNALTSLEKINVKAEREISLAQAAFNALPEKERIKKYGKDKDAFNRYSSELEKQRAKTGLSSEEFYGLMAAGYKPEKTKNKGFFSFRLSFRSEKQVVTSDGKKIWMKEKDFKALATQKAGVYENSTTTEAQDRLNTRWNNEVAKQVEASMAETANDFNGAVERAKSGYERTREALLLEFIGSLSEEQLSPAQLKARERIFGQKGKAGKDITSLLAALDSKSGKFARLNGKGNDRTWKAGLNDFGFSDFSPSSIRGISSGASYERAKREKGGLTRLFLETLKQVAEGFNANKNRI